MAKHRLLVYQLLSRRVRGKLFWLALVLLIVGVIDQFNSFLGDNWWLLWLTLPFVLILWFYYAILTRRAAIEVGPKILRLQGPLVGFNISYGRVYTVTSGKFGSHYPREILSRGQRSLLKPVYYQTCVFVALSSYPPNFKRWRWWFPTYLFGSSQPGLLLHVDDWMALTRDIESARAVRQASVSGRRDLHSQTLVGRILTEDPDSDRRSGF